MKAETGAPVEHSPRNTSYGRRNAIEGQFLIVNGDCVPYALFCRFKAIITYLTRQKNNNGIGFAATYYLERGSDSTLEGSRYRRFNNYAVVCSHFNNGKIPMICSCE